jgi:hypothetical protein
LYNESGRGGRYSAHSIVSVGGGINLRPKDFARPLQVVDSSPIIQRFRSSREILRSSISSEPEANKKALVFLSESSKAKHIAWNLVSEQSTSDMIKRRWKSSDYGERIVESDTKSGYLHHQVRVKGYFSELTVKPGRREVVMATFGYPAEIIAIGDFARDERIALRKGKIIEPQRLNQEIRETHKRNKWVRTGKQ